MGFGIVGSGVADLIANNAERVAAAAGEEIVLKRILDLRDFPTSRFAPIITHRFEDILEDPEIQIVAECMGGTTFAFDYTKRLLLAGKHVVTSNKDLVAAHGAELLAIAKEKNVNYLFEASVGGGIPILRPLTDDLAANSISEVYGILNGTTNYILTQMTEKGNDFQVALKEAQNLGYAESNPTKDVDGIDTANKVSILASLIFGRHVYPENVQTEGISSVTRDDIAMAASTGYRIKLIGRATLDAQGDVFCYVAPHLVGAAHELYGVNGVYNGILVRGDYVGDVMFYGKGAGKYPTASAVAADIIDAAKHAGQRKDVYWEDGASVSDGSDFASRWYIRTEDPCDASLFEEFQMISASAFLTGRITNHNFRRIMDLFRKNYRVACAFRVLD